MKLMTFTGVVKADLCRYTNIGFASFIKSLIFNPAFRLTFFFRLCRYLKAHPWLLIRFLLYPVKFFYRLGEVRFGISLPIETEVGPGFYIGHYGGIVINGRATIGQNCNLSQGVTIGQTNRGIRKGVPSIGNSVYIGPGAKIIGGISIGDFAAIGANAVVTRDIPKNGVAVGIPARVISLAGSVDYVERIDYPPVTF